MYRPIPEGHRVTVGYQREARKCKNKHGDAPDDGALEYLINFIVIYATLFIHK